MKKLLPIGSVVLLKGAEKRSTIIGYNTVVKEDKKEYDYIGIPYPEGYIDDETMFAFQQEDIEKIGFVGYINAECQIFQTKLSKAMVKKENA